MPALLDLDKARKELDAKDLLTIERDTALTWGGRAAASYILSTEDEDHAEQMRCFWEAETYRAEAVEHAAMTEDFAFVEAITKEIEDHRVKARAVLLASGHQFVEGNRTPATQRGPRPAPNPSSPGRPPSETPTRGQRAASPAQ